MIKIETRANRIVMGILIGMSLFQVFMFSVGFGYGFTNGILGR